MDRERFDAVTRLFANRSSRRAAIGGLLGAALLRGSSDASADPGKGKAKGHGKGKGQGREDPPGRLPGGGGDPGDGSTCVPSRCPRDPATGRRGFCCTGGWCSCGSQCCAGPECAVITDQVGGEESTIFRDREACCTTCSDSGDTCCAGCVNGNCIFHTPIGGGSIRNR